MPLHSATESDFHSQPVHIAAQSAVAVAEGGTCAEPDPCTSTSLMDTCAYYAYYSWYYGYSCADLTGWGYDCTQATDCGFCGALAGNVGGEDKYQTKANALSLLPSLDGDIPTTHDSVAGSYSTEKNDSRLASQHDVKIVVGGGYNSEDYRLAEGFNIYTSDDEGVTWSYDGSSYETNYQVDPGGVGCYAVSAYDSSPEAESALSNVACIDEAACPVAGDSNGDGSVNVADIVALVNQILYADGAVGDYLCGDTDENGAINVADIVSLVNIILYSRTADVEDAATQAQIVVSEDTIKIEANGFVQGVQMKLSCDEISSIDLVDAFVSEHSDDMRTFVIASDGSTSITDVATFVGDNCKVESAVVVNQLEDELDFDTLQLAAFKVKIAGPNPFNPSTQLNVVVPEAGYVSVNIYNILGQEVATLVDGYMEASTLGHTVTWNAENLASGIYLVRAITAGKVSTQKLMLLK